MYAYKYSVDKYQLCMIKVRVRWCENVITLGKLIGLCPLSSLFKTPKNTRNELMSSPCNGNHFSSIILFVLC